MKHFLEKDKITVVNENRPPNSVLSQPADPCTPRRTRAAANSQPTGSSTEVASVPCRYGCGEMIAIGNSRHYLHECSAINRVYDPGGTWIIAGFFRWQDAQRV